MLVGFEKWWQEQGRSLDPDTEDVPWYDKREALAHIAFDEGVRIGMALAGNYTASDEVAPDFVRFANGRTVQIGEHSGHGLSPYLVIGREEDVMCSCGNPVSKCSRLHDDHYKLGNYILNSLGGLK